MLGGDTVGARERVADDAAGEIAAPVRQRRGGPAVVPQIGVAAKQAMACAEIPVEPGIELVGRGGVATRTPIVVRRGLSSGGREDVGRGVTVEHSQRRAVEPAGRRKVVLSTNVAETSVTIDGVTTVIDSGLARLASHSPWSGLPTLATVKISRASATQRAGRAGRTREGRVLRLYTKGDFESRREHELPEVARADLSEAVLALAGAGIADPAALSWLTPPPEAALTAARESMVKQLTDILAAHGKTVEVRFDEGPVLRPM